MRFTDIQIGNSGFRGQDGNMRFSAEFPLFLINEAWSQRCDFEDLADGFGPGEGTHGDWSSIRDSTPEAIAAIAPSRPQPPVRGQVRLRLRLP